MSKGLYLGWLVCPSDLSLCQMYLSVHLSAY